MDGSWRLVVAVPNTEHLELGASVAIDGVCLTAVAVHGDEVAFDVIAETMDRSTIGDRKAGDEVNVERALRFGDEVGATLYLGTCSIPAASGTSPELGRPVTFIEASEATMRYIFEKGYIAISGISLTVGRCEDDGFYLHLIPETLARTTLGKATRR